MYPRVEISLQKLQHNAAEIVKRCGAIGIEVSGVVKGFNGIPACSKTFQDAGCAHIASSRLEQLQAAADYGITAPRMLIRAVTPVDAAETVRLAHISLQSETETLTALAAEAQKQGKSHEVILMADLGDLREGFWDQDELLQAALMVENELPGLILAGVGTNLGCYGAISATAEKLEELIALAERIEAKIGRTLRYISGGATTSLPRMLEANMPKRINHLRVGEGIILARDLQDLWGYDMHYMHRDVFTLKAEVIEVRDKPSHPIGEIMFDAFGHQPEYEDRGIRRRALLGLGKVDYAFPDMIFPRDAGVEVIGASSDHTILDVQDAERDLRVGDVLAFDLSYATIVYVTNCPNVKIVLLD